MKFAIQPASSITAHPDVVTRTIEDEEVLLHLGSGEYFGLDEVGTRSWDLLTNQGLNFGDAVKALSEEFDVPRSMVENDMRELIRELHASELIEIQEV